VGERNSAEAEVERIMLRIRAELAQPGPGAPASQGTSASSSTVKDLVKRPLSSVAQVRPPEDLPLPAPIRLALSESDGVVWQSTFQPTPGRRYHIRELFDYQDRDFIVAAYWAVLQREPDDGGFNTYLGLLRGGTSKIEILEFLRDSPEGRAAEITVAGQSIQARILKITRWPILGFFGRIAASLWNLPEAQRRLRLLEGNLFSSIEQNQARTTKALRVVNKALRDVETAHYDLAMYAASKLGNDARRRIEASIASVNNSVGELRKLADSKANFEDTRLAFREVAASRELLLHSLDTKAERPELKALASTVQNSLDEVSGELRNEKTARIELANQITLMRSEAKNFVARVEKFNAEMAGLNELRMQLARLMATKAERPELKALASTVQRSLDDVSAELRMLKAERGDLENQFAVMRNEGMNFLAHVEKSNAEMVRLEAARQLLMRSLETKAERPELSSLASTTQRSLDEVSGELQKLKAERSDLDNQFALIRSEGVNFLTHVEKSNAEMVRLDEARQLLTHSLEAKAERPELSSLASTMQHSLDEVSGELLKLKAERADLGNQFAVMRSEGLNFLAHVEKSNAEIMRLEEARQLLMRSLETKVERPELETLTNLILGDVQARPTKEDIAEVKGVLDATLSGVVHTISQLSETKVDRITTETDKEELRNFLEAMRTQSKEDLHDALAGVNARTRDIKLNLLDQERRLGLLLEEARKRLPAPLSSSQIKIMVAEEDHVLDAMYAEFEDIFRGTRADIMQRQSIYIPIVREAGAGEKSTPIVDLGCGRGEWLELLRDSGLGARGVDLNRIFLQRCRDLSLEVVESDAIAYLRDAKRNSLGAVTSFHLIEHLPHKSLIAMLDAGFRALRPGGLVILETPNPRNLQVGSCNFYLDPTHRNPLPPDLMKYVMEARGFVNVVIKELHPYSAEHLATDGPAKINEILNRFLFSSQDYAVIGRKP
jgi:SAM-dependent methyltransferase